MEKEFVPYELALRMKALGFDEPCCGYYDHTIKELDTISSDVCERLCVHDTHIKAPTFSQAFRWFRDKYNLHSIIGHDSDNYYYTIQGVNDIDFTTFDSCEEGILYLTCEETEEASLKKLIEIVEEKLINSK